MAIPRRGCSCAVCRDARGGGRSRRSRSSLLLRYAGKNILIDASPDFLEQVEREKIKSIDAVFITHGHADAAGGLGQLERWLAGREKPRVVQLFLEKATWRQVFKKNKTFKYLRPLFIKLGQKIKFAGIQICPFRVRHSMTSGFPTIGFRFGDFLVYASDVGEVPPLSRQFFFEVNIILLDGAMYFGKYIKAHFNAAEALRFIKKLKGVKQVYLTQLGHTYPSHEQAEKAVKKYWREIGGNSKTKVGLAFDGMSIKIK